jgi:hypothetical protein
MERLDSIQGNSSQEGEAAGSAQVPVKMGNKKTNVHFVLSNLIL